MDAATYIRFAASLVFVLGLILGGLWLLRRFGAPGMTARRPGKKRLALIESLPVDARRRLLLVARDGVEHLLLIGPNADLLVEGNIGAGRDFRTQLAQINGAESPKENMP